MAEIEQPLIGGNVTTGIVRIGDTVRRPAGPWTSSVHALLTHLVEAGFEACPKSYGIDDQGRHVLEWIEGAVTHPYAPATRRSPSVREVGRTIRALHDAVAGFRPPPDAVWGRVIDPDSEDLIVHQDLCSWNFVHGETRFAFIDWDLAEPGSALWDIALSAHGFAGVGTDMPSPKIRARLRDLADGYGLDENGRLELVELMPVRFQSMHRLLESGDETGAEPWARLWREGHGEAWRNIAALALAQKSELKAALLA